MFSKRWKVLLSLSLVLAAVPAAVFLVSCSAQSIPNSGVAIPTPVPGVFGPGAIAFTGLTYNGNSEISFVSTVNVNAGVTIFFTNETYDSTLNSGAGGLVDESTTASAQSTWPGNSSPTNWESNATTILEGIINYIVPAGGLPSYTQVIIGNTSNATNQLQGGTVNSVSGTSANPWVTLNHNGAGQKVLAFTVSNAGVTTWLGAVIFGPDSWWQNIANGTAIPQYNFWDTDLPPGLSTSTSTDLSGLWNNDDLAQYNNASDQNDNAVLDSCQTTLAAIINSNNWIADGNASKSKVSLNPLVTLSSQCSTAGYTGNLY